MDAAYGAQRRASLVTVILPLQILGAILLERDARVAPLLRTPVHEAVLADVEIPCTGTAVPLVGLPVGEVLLEAVVIREVED